MLRPVTMVEDIEFNSYLKARARARGQKETYLKARSKEVSQK